MPDNSIINSEQLFFIECYLRQTANPQLILKMDRLVDEQLPPIAMVAALENIIRGANDK